MFDNLPRIAGELRMGDQSQFYLSVCADKVCCDEHADDVVALVAHIEERKRRTREWCDAMCKRLDGFAEKLKDSPAWQSLPKYVKSHPTAGKKTLELPSGKIRVTNRKDVLVVHNKKAIVENVPEACYEYEPPKQIKVSNDKLKKLLKERKESTLVADTGAGIDVVAELLPEVETLSVTPNETALAPNLSMPNIHPELHLLPQKGEEDD